MKKIHTLFYTALSLTFFLVLLLSSCDKMNDIQRDFADKEEAVYLGKVDSVKSYPGFGKVKLVWYMNADPKISKTIIYWNLRKDSIVRTFNRTALGGQRDSVVLQNLPEGSMLVEFRNVNDKGETSLFSSATITVWGANFADGLRARSVTAFDYDYLQTSYNLTLSKTTPGDSVAYSQISYTTSNNQPRVINTVRSVNDTAVVLTDFPVGGSFQFRTVFFPPQGIDTVRNEYQTFKAPDVVTDRGTKIALKGNATSRYFQMNDDLGEWNAAGDLIVYAVGAGGELTEKMRYPALAPRATFRDLFFYEGDRFIGVQTNNNLYMYTITNGVLTNILTTTLGTGFTFLKYVPGRGFFYSIAETSGEVKAWFALPNGTWLTPQSAVVGTGFNYVPYALFNFQSLMGIDATGYLWTVPVSATAAIGSKSRMGLGWNRFTKIIPVGTSLYGMQSNGDLYVYNNFDATGKYWIVN
ncbi:DUF4998 domain-containing protein [Niabella pedocola]|uniref:DUF4998 domain-containing protein n=1 Tax=Niabella pedocola TaxID=1752077 RepID=A0ABS8PMX4_9BACT|nr:DUF4998 domain-containing protein [Niabella pedocola]MCD2422454.1 DUF4998 domain-containing protein [Niabella pedocola]